MPMKLLATGFLIVAGAVPLAAQTTASDTVTLARQLLGQQKRAEAIAMLEPFVAGHPKNGGAWLALGNAHRQLGHLNHAAEALTRAAALPIGPLPLAAMS